MLTTQINQAHLESAAKLMKEGELVAFPTETVYGLGARVSSHDSIAKIFLAKGRPQDNPLIVHISHLDQIHTLCDEIPDEFYLLAKHFLPGPLTIILKRKKEVPKIVSGGLPTIAVRMPAHPIARRLIELVGEPIAAPSANLSGRPSATSMAHVLEDLDGKIAGVIDGGVCEHGIESTVLALGPSPIIYRPGSVTLEAIEKVLNKKVLIAEGKSLEKPLSPGLKYRHYAPNASVHLFDSKEALENFLKCSTKKKMVLTSIRQEELYEKLRQADRNGIEEVLILCDTQVSSNRGLMNRLRRASEK